MKCSICGKDVPEGSATCPNCGMRMAPPESAWPSIRPDADGRAEGDPLPGEFRAGQPIHGAAEPHGTPAAAVRELPAPRRRHKALIVIAILLAVLIGGGFIAYQVFGRDIRRQLLGPKKSYLMIEGLAMKNGMDSLAGSIANSRNQEDKPAGADTSVSFKLAAPLPGINANLMKTINSLKLQTRTLVDRKATGPKLYSKSDIYLGSEQLLSLEAFAAEDQLTVGLPGLIQQYVAIPLSGQSGSASPIDGESLSSALKLGFERAPLVDKAQLAASMKKVADVFLTNIDSAEFADKVPVTAGGVTVPYECYTIKSNGRQLRDMAVGTLELIRDEKPLNDLIYPYVRDRYLSGVFAQAWNGYNLPAGQSGKTITESEWKAMLTQAIERLKAAKDADLEDTVFTQRVYLDKQDTIHGRELTVMKKSQPMTVDFKYLAPVKDNQHGLLIALASDDGDNAKPFDVQFTTNFELKDGLMTGSADVLADGKTPFTAVYRGLGIKGSGSDGRLVGEIDVNADAKALGASAPIPKITFKGAVSGSHYVIDIGAANLVSVNIDQASIASADVKIPSLGDKTLVKATDQAALTRLMTPAVQMKLLAIIQKLGIDPSMVF